MKNSPYSVSHAEVSPICKHCGRRSANPIESNGNFFCCKGCFAVFALLQKQGLDNFYEVKKSVSQQPLSLIPSGEDGFAYADSPDFIKAYAYGGHQQVLDVYVEGVHCAACLWLLEKLPEHVHGVQSARLNLADSTLTIISTKPGFSAALQQIQNWGYKPRPLKNTSEQQFWSRRDLHRDLFRIGVAAFCAGNIMLMSVCIYAGLLGELKTLFVFLSLILSLPVVTFSAMPLYRASLQGLRRGSISIDLPIVLALAVAFFTSVYAVFYGGETYFDSLTALVFLILSSRFYLKQIQSKHLTKTRLQMYFDVLRARRWNGEEFVDEPIEALATGDRLLVKTGETVPVDGIIESGAGELNVSLLSGESAPVVAQIKQPVMMGSKLVSGEIELTATCDFKNSRVQKLLRDLDTETPQAKSLQVAERVGQAFLSVVFLIAGGTVLLWWSVDPSEGIYRALSFMIVACPCTFASVLPLVFGLALKKSAREGVFIKDPTLYERIGKINKIYLDKTGVLTKGVFEVQSFRWQVPASKLIVERICAAVIESDHPVSRALARYLSLTDPKLVSREKVHVEVLPGRGMKARFFDGSSVRIEKAATAQGLLSMIPNSLEIFFNDQLVAHVNLGDYIRDEAADVVARLHDRGFECWVISGDQISTVHQVAAAVGIPQCRALGDLTFEDKKRIVQDGGPSLMIGDGNNDALALQAASIGIAMEGGVESALRSSDVYVASGELRSVLPFISDALTAKKMIWISLSISVFYNIVAGGLALGGWVHPLLAAFIMPINAMTVFTVCLLVFRTRRNQWT